VARPSLRVRDSGYYPPRARWYNRLFLNPRRALRRWVHFERLGFTASLSPGRLLLSLIFPSFAFFTLGRRWLGWLFLAIYTVSLGVFVVRLGYPAANIAFGLLIFAHATSIIFAEGVWVGNERFGLRLGLAFGTLLGVWALVYGPLVHFAERHLVIPMQVRDRIVVVRAGVATSLKRGEWVAYQITDKTIGGPGNVVNMNAGLGLDQVLALPGDNIRFTPEAFWVNEQPSPSRSLMPPTGELVVPRNVWFIWPNSSMNISGPRANTAGAVELMLRTAMVDRDRILGRPFQHWFWRRQLP
jgi:hypothetical protein